MVLLHHCRITNHIYNIIDKIDLLFASQSLHLKLCLATAG